MLNQEYAHAPVLGVKHENAANKKDDIDHQRGQSKQTISPRSSKLRENVNLQGNQTHCDPAKQPLVASTQHAYQESLSVESTKEKNHPKAMRQGEPNSKKKNRQKKKGRQQTRDITESKKKTDNGVKDDDGKIDSVMPSWFSHLAPCQASFPSSGVGENESMLHRSVLNLGRLYEQGIIRGGNARCRAMLECFSKLTSDYVPSDNVQDIREHFTKNVLKAPFSYWTEHCRRHSVSMGKAFTLLKTTVASLERGTIMLESLQNAVQKQIDTFIRERIDQAGMDIVQHASTKIVDGDVLLVHGYSEVICKVLLAQKELKKKFRVIVADSYPLLEGRIMLKALLEAGIPCTYMLLQSVSYLMKDITKVLLGASAVMADGSVQGRAGTACVALMAQRKPVLVCCETYKMTHQVQLDGIASNELADPASLVLNAKKQNNLQPLSIMYDLTPSLCITGFITEAGILPPTSVAVLLREYGANRKNASEAKKYNV